MGAARARELLMELSYIHPRLPPRAGVVQRQGHR